MTPREQELVNAICPTIQSGNLIRLWYRNSNSGLQDWRTVEPYLIGSFPRKHPQLSAWFLPTPAQALVGQKEGWRAYWLKNISDLDIPGETFSWSRPDYDPTGNGMIHIVCAAKKLLVPFMKID